MEVMMICTETRESLLRLNVGVSDSFIWRCRREKKSIANELERKYVDIYTEATYH